MALDSWSSSPLAGVSAPALREAIEGGHTSVAEFAERLLSHIEKFEPEIRAFAWFDADYVREQAAHLDAYKRTGAPLGPLHGVPVAIKDIIDTQGIPTENGTAIDSGRIPKRDATLVQRLRSAGALIIGKTVTTELAFLQPSITKNPHDLECTPGGSSAGSAAAVAAGMVSIAIGSQTGGSVIRPASFCGVFGFKPTFGLIPRTGMLTQSPTLDTVGVFGQTIEDVALATDVLAGFDELDVATEAGPGPQALTICRQRVPVKPMFAVLELPFMDRASQDMRDALTEVAEFLGDQAFVTGLPNAFSEAVAARETINFAEMAKCYYRYSRDHQDALSSHIQNAITKGEATLARDYLAALDWKSVLCSGLDEIFERCDVMLCPAAPGEAPTPETTGDAIFNGIWTLTGHPTLTIPVLTGSSGMPMGLQIIGRHGFEGRLLRTARWLVETMAAAETEETTP